MLAKDLNRGEYGKIIEGVYKNTIVKWGEHGLFNILNGAFHTSNAIYLEIEKLENVKITYDGCPETKPSGIIKRIICSNNPNIDLPQVIDEIEELAEIEYTILNSGSMWIPNANDCNKANKQEGFIKGYKKSQETHSFSEDDMLNLIQSLKDYTRESGAILGYDEREPKEFLDIWKEQQVKTIYYG